MRWGRRYALFVLAWAAWLPAGLARADEPPEYSRDIRPLFEKHCFECHGSRQQESGLRLDVKAAALKGGDSKEAALVPGSSDKSRLIKLITSDDPKVRMPHEAEALKAEEVALLRKWIDAGAHWTEAGDVAAAEAAPGTGRKITEQDRQFWSFIPPRHVDPPATKDTSWPRGPIDRFVLARLESRGLSPAAEAPRRTLVRRMTYDLTGLPPTPEEVEAFVKDATPQAAEKIVDKLLNSPHFDERWGRHWLDVARYAESSGK
jgi:mono/diheme cytochrome c family protein